MGRAVGQNQLFYILLKIDSLDFSFILHQVKGQRFSAKLSFFQKREKRVQKWAKMGFLDFCAKLSHYFLLEMT